MYSYEKKYSTHIKWGCNADGFESNPMTQRQDAKFSRWIGILDSFHSMHFLNDIFMLLKTKLIQTDF